MSEPILPYVLIPQADAEGKELPSAKLPKPSYRDQSEILENLRIERRGKLKVNLQESGISKEQVFAELEGFDDKPYGFDEFLRHFNSYKGKLEIFLFLAKKLYDGKADEVLAQFGYAGGNLTKELMPLLGLKLTDEKEGGEADENPPTPGAETSPPTPSPLRDIIPV